MRWILAAVLLVAAAAAGEEPLNTLTVRIENVGPRGGTLNVAVHDAASYGGGSAPRYARSVKPIVGTTIVTFVGVVPGVYGVSVVQDVDRNQTHGHHLLGATTVPIGFSGTAGRDGKPPFRAIQFSVGPGDNATLVRMHE